MIEEYQIDNIEFLNRIQNYIKNNSSIDYIENLAKSNRIDYLLNDEDDNLNNEE